MKKRASTPRRDTASTPQPDRASPPGDIGRLSAGSIDPGTTSCATPRTASLELSRAIDHWFADGRAQGWSARTLGNRQHLLAHFIWWLENEEKVAATLGALTAARIRAFMAYAREPNREGRYGSASPSAKRAARPSTARTYHSALRAFVNFCLAEGLLADSPFRNIKPPRLPGEPLPSAPPETVQTLLDGARRSQNPDRDVAIIYVLTDAGLRAEELCNLCIGDVDRGTGELMVTGKGNKRRVAFLGLSARRALWRYLEADRRQALSDEPLFVSGGGTRSGSALTPSGVYQILRKAGEAAGVKCGPHTLRRTFALNFLRGGGSLMELATLLGHSDLTVLKRYVALQPIDLAQAHRKASPADRMKLR